MKLGYPKEETPKKKKLCELKYLSNKRKRNQPRFSK